jgi:hypothetical protein
MAGLLPWILLFFLLFFCGVFFWFFFSVRNQDHSLYAILQQQKAIRLEVARLAATLDSLLADRVLAEEEPEPAEIGKNGLPAVSPERLVPGIDRLLLEPRAPEKPSRAVDSLPDLKL